MISSVQMSNCIYLEVYFLLQNKIHSHPPKSLTVVHVSPRNTVWPSPAGISSSFSVQPAAALPLGYWCSAPSVQSLLSEQKERVRKLRQSVSKHKQICRFNLDLVEKFQVTRMHIIQQHFKNKFEADSDYMLKCS